MALEPATIHGHLDAVAFTAEGGLLLSASCLTNRLWSGSLWYFDEPDTAPDVERVSAGSEADSSISDMVVLPENRVVTAADSGSVALWRLDTHSIQCEARAIEHDNIVASVSATADHTTVISASHDCSIKLWDIEKFVSTKTYRAHKDLVRCVCCHPSDSNLFISASQDERLLLWDLRQNKPASLLDTNALASSASCVAWQPGMEHGIVVGTETGQLVVQDIRRGVTTPVIVQAHNRTISKLQFAPHKPSWVASCAEDCRVCVTAVDSGKVIFHDDYHQDFVRGVAWDQLSYRLFSCGWDGNVGGREIVQTEGLSSPLATMDISEKKQQNALSPEQMDAQPQCNGHIDDGIMVGTKG